MNGYALTVSETHEKNNSTCVLKFDPQNAMPDFYMLVSHLSMWCQFYRKEYRDMSITVTCENAPDFIFMYDYDVVLLTHMLAVKDKLPFLKEITIRTFDKVKHVISNELNGEDFFVYIKFDDNLTNSNIDYVIDVISYEHVKLNKSKESAYGVTVTLKKLDQTMTLKMLCGTPQLDNQLQEILHDKIQYLDEIKLNRITKVNCKKTITQRLVDTVIQYDIYNSITKSDAETLSMIIYQDYLTYVKYRTRNGLLTVERKYGRQLGTTVTKNNMFEVNMNFFLMDYIKSSCKDIISVSITVDN